MLAFFSLNTLAIFLGCGRPSSEQLGTFKDFVRTFPEIDTPEIFGLHPNADLTFRVKEVNALFGTLGNTQPKVVIDACTFQHKFTVEISPLINPGDIFVLSRADRFSAGHFNLPRYTAISKYFL